VRRAAAGAALSRSAQPCLAGGTAIGARARDFWTGRERMVGRIVVMIASTGSTSACRPARGAMRSCTVDRLRWWLNPLRDRGLRADSGRDERARPFVTTFTSITDRAGLARLSRLVHLRV
jgi:hypothetical protein